MLGYVGILFLVMVGGLFIGLGGGGRGFGGLCYVICFILMKK